MGGYIERVETTVGVIVRFPQLRVKSQYFNTRGKRHHCRGLTVGIRFVRVKQRYLAPDLGEDNLTHLQFPRSPKLLKNLGGAQDFGLCIFESPLVTPQLSLQMHGAAQKVWGVGRVRVGAFGVGLGVSEIALARI